MKKVRKKKKKRKRKKKKKVETKSPDTKTTTTTTTSTIQNYNGKCKGKSTNGKWEALFDGSVRVYCNEPLKRTKVAGFDMDGTIIKPKSGAVHPKSADDWIWWDECVPDHLRQIHKDGYQVVIFTNQSGINVGSKFNSTRATQITTKIKNIEKELGIPLIAFISCADDLYRKPSRKMWDLFADEYSTIQIDASESYYIGDAAGRPARGAKKADFSAGDLGFAKTVGVKFETPETYFLGEPLDILEPTAHLPKAPTTGDPVKDCPEIVSKEFELVLFVGWPASGKSTFARTYFAPAGYAIVNQDTLKTKDKCIKVAKESLSQKKSTVIDNTNPQASTRAEYIKLAKLYGASVRCFHFQTDRQMAEHLNYFRERKQGVKHIGSIVYNMFNKNFDEPNTKEGIKSVHKVDFILKVSPEDQAMFEIPPPKTSKKK